MHLECEALLTGNLLSEVSPELRLFARFLTRLRDIKAYRTEWAMFADRENLAGSIDFVAQQPNGSLVLCDWKRTKGIWNKSNGFGKCMLPPLSHIPDATIWHYRLQLNIYRRILESYYNAEVAAMYVVRSHPDNGTEPFVDAVPFMDSEANALLQYQANKQKASDADRMGGSSDLSTLILQERYFCPPVHPAFTMRVWSQLKQFYDRVSPFELLLEKYPLLHFTLPLPIDCHDSLRGWRLRLEVACFFLSLLEEEKPIQLEAALIAWFWPEIRRIRLLDLVSTARSSVNTQDRVRQLASAWLCLQTLSPPSRGQILHTKCEGSFSHRVGLLHRAMMSYEQTVVAIKDTRHTLSRAVAAQRDCLGGSSPPNLVVLSQIEAEIEAEYANLEMMSERKDEAELPQAKEEQDFAAAAAQRDCLGGSSPPNPLLSSQIEAEIEAEYANLAMMSERKDEAELSQAKEGGSRWGEHCTGRFRSQ